MNEKNLAIIYYMYHDSHEPWIDLAYPVVPAIATARAWCPDASIYLIDSSDHETNWGKYPDMLGFKVVRKTAYLKEHNIAFRTPLQPGRVQDHAIKLVSRIFDVSEFIKTVPEDVVLFSDCDVFWVDRILPLRSDLDKFCCNQNSGVWYFDKNSQVAWDFFDVWKTTLLLGAHDPVLRNKIETFCSHKTYMCESALRYILQMDVFKRMTNEIQRVENFVLNDKSWPLLKNGTKNVHLTCGQWGASRARACKMFKEIRESILKVMGEDDFDLLIPGQMKEESLYAIRNLKALRLRVLG